MRKYDRHLRPLIAAAVLLGLAGSASGLGIGSGEGLDDLSTTGTRSGGARSITGLSLSSTSYPSSASAGTNIGTFSLTGNGNGAATFGLSGPDAARFQFSTPCTGASCSLQYSGTNPDGFADGIFHIFVTPTLNGARGSGVVYPFEIAATITCNSTIATGFTDSNITTAIASASGSSPYNICLQGVGTISTGVTVNKAQVRISGIGVGATSNNNWYSAVPQISVTGATTSAFNVTANAVEIDHVAGIGVTPPAFSSSSCSSAGQQFVEATSSISGLTAVYNQTTNFGCVYALGSGTVSGAALKYNSILGWSEAGIVCFPCASSTAINNNTLTSVNPGGGHSNSYGILMSSSALSSSVSTQNNQMLGNPLWECYDSHGGADIVFSSNYCLAPHANAAISTVAISGANLTRPRVNSNVIDFGTGCPSCNTVDETTTGAGTTMDCTGGDLQGCQVESNTMLDSPNDSVGCGLITSGANGGTLTTGTGNQVQTVSGNSCNNALGSMAAPVLVTDQPSNQFVANQAGGVIGKITVTMTPAFPAWVGGWPNYGGWPGMFSIGGTNASSFQICVDGQHICQAAGGVSQGSYNITLTGTLTGLSNSPQTSSTITLTGS